MSLTSRQIERKVGLKFNTLNLYVQLGALIPDVDPGRGTGTKRLFSETNLVEAIILRDLIAFGFPRRWILVFFRSIRQTGERSLLDPEQIFKDKGIKYIYFYIIPGNNVVYSFFNDLNDKMLKDLPDIFLLINLSKIGERAKFMLLSGF